MKRIEDASESLLPFVEECRAGQRYRRLARLLHYQEKATSIRSQLSAGRSKLMPRVHRADVTAQALAAGHPSGRREPGLLLDETLAGRRQAVAVDPSLAPVMEGALS